MDWPEFRAAFPALENQIYLNTAGGGPICSAAATAGSRYFQDLEATGDRNWPQWLEAVEECRTRVARLLNGTPEQIAFVQNVSLALNHVAAMTASPETRVLIPRGEFPSVSLPWINRGCRLTEFGFDGMGRPDGLPGREPIDWVVASQVQYRSGVALDLREIKCLCRGLKAGLVLDSTQAFGVTPIDLGDTPVDAMGFSVYKWAGAGYGVGILYLRDGFLERYGYPAVGWRSSDDPYALAADRLTTTGKARDLELGHPPVPAVLALNPALELIERVGVAAIERRIQSLVERLRSGLSALNLDIATPEDPGRRAAITVVRSDTAAAMAAALQARDILVSQFDDKLRISCHAYNNEADVDALLTALEETRTTRPRKSR